MELNIVYVNRRNFLLRQPLQTGGSSNMTIMISRQLNEIIPFEIKLSYFMIIDCS